MKRMSATTKLLLKPQTMRLSTKICGHHQDFSICSLASSLPTAWMFPVCTCKYASPKETLCLSYTNTRT